MFLYRGVGLVGSPRRTSAAPPYVSSAVAASVASPASASSRDAARTRARSSRGNEGSLASDRRGSPRSPLVEVAFETSTVAFAAVEAHAALAHAIVNVAKSARRASALPPRRRARMVETRGSDNLHLLPTGARALGYATPSSERFPAPPPREIRSATPRVDILIHNRVGRRLPYPRTVREEPAPRGTGFPPDTRRLSLFYFHPALRAPRLVDARVCYLRKYVIFMSYDRRGTTFHPPFPLFCHRMFLVT